MLTKFLHAEELFVLCTVRKKITLPQQLVVNPTFFNSFILDLQFSVLDRL